MNAFRLLILIFFALTISADIVGIVASFNAVRRYQKSLDILHECEDILSILERYRRQG
jgi:hypothetical protein